MGMNRQRDKWDKEQEDKFYMMIMVHSNKRTNAQRRKGDKEDQLDLTI